MPISFIDEEDQEISKCDCCGFEKKIVMEIWNIGRNVLDLCDHCYDGNCTCQVSKE